MKGRLYAAPVIAGFIAVVLYYVAKDGFGYTADAILSAAIQGILSVIISLIIPDKKESFDEEPAVASPGNPSASGMPPSSNA